jgi:hypothetical protein
MESSRVPQKILYSKPGRKRNIGRPRLRWLDVVVNDLKNMGCNKERRLKIDENGQE